MSDRAYTKVQAQQKTLIRSSPKSSLLQRTCACGQHTIAGGKCSTCRSEKSMLLRSQRTLGPPSAPVDVQGNSPAQENISAVVERVAHFGHDLSQIPIHPTQAAVLQTKLRVNQPGDIYEQEADQVAEEVMRRDVPGSAMAPDLPDDDEQTEKSLLRKQETGSSTYVATNIDSVPPVVHAVLNSGRGKPLDTTTRAFMDPRFGYDFSRVRVHTGAQAAESARTVNALAYTVGRNVVFGTGQYAPATTTGQRLLAHELTHVVQQEGSRQRLMSNICADLLPRQITDGGDEAFTFSSRRQSLTASSSQAGTLLQRQPKPPIFEQQKDLEARTKEGGHSRLAELAGELLIIELKTELMQPSFQSDDNLQSQHKMLAGHIEYVTDLIMQARQADKIDPELLLAIEVGLHLAGMNANLLQVELNAQAARVRGVVSGPVKQGLAWSWEGMRELKADPSWPARKPAHVKQVLVSTEVFFEQARDAIPRTLVMQAGVRAAEAVTAARFLSLGLSRIVNWMGGLKIESAVFAFEGTGGSITVFKLVSSSGSLALTDAEVIALAEEGIISATAFNLYMTAQGSGGGGSSGGGKPKVPNIPSGVKSSSEFGNKIMKWGTTDAQARARIATLTREELQRSNVTKEMAEAWRDFYREIKVQFPKNPSAAGRMDLMQKAVELLSGGK